MQQVVSVTNGVDMEIIDKLAKLYAMIFVCYSISSAIGIAYFLLFFLLLITYQIEKFIFVRNTEKPIKLDYNLL